MHRKIALCGALASLALASPAAAQTEPVVYTTTPTYFTCTAPTKVHNGTAMGLSTTAPAASFTAGAGCGFVEPTVLIGTAPGNSTVDAVFEGTFKGPVKNAVVELHQLLTNRVEQQLGGTMSFDAMLVVDGREVFSSVDADPVEAPATVSSTGASSSAKVTFDLSRLNYTTDVVRSFQLTVRGAYIDYPAGGWVAGATEVPSGITFNAEKPAGPVLRGA